MNSLDILNRSINRLYTINVPKEYNTSMTCLTSITLSHAQWESMHSHVHITFPREACGVLAGRQGRVCWVEPITNVEDNPNRFRMDPQEQLKVMLRIEDDGLELVGIYHSHPNGPADLSESDIREAAYPEAANVVWFLSNKRWSCRAFIIAGLAVREIPVRLTG